MGNQQSDPVIIKSGELIPFPFNFRTKQVRQCADALMTKSERAATAYWELTLIRMGEKLLRFGFSQCEVVRQYMAFKRDG